MDTGAQLMLEGSLEAWVPSSPGPWLCHVSLSCRPRQGVITGLEPVLFVGG